MKKSDPDAEGISILAIITKLLAVTFVLIFFVSFLPLENTNLFYSFVVLPSGFFLAYLMAKIFIRIFYRLLRNNHKGTDKLPSPSDNNPLEDEGK